MREFKGVIIKLRTYLTDYVSSLENPIGYIDTAIYNLSIASSLIADIFVNIAHIEEINKTDQDVFEKDFDLLRQLIPNKDYNVKEFLYWSLTLVTELENRLPSIIEDENYLNITPIQLLKDLESNIREAKYNIAYEINYLNKKKK